MLKYRLKHKLYNNLFFLDYEKLKLKLIYQKELECLQLLHHANLLFRKNEYTIAISLANKILKISERYDLLNVTISALEILLKCYFDEGNIKLYQNIDKKLIQLIQIKNYEAQALSLFGLIRLQLKKTIKIRKELIEKLPPSLQRLDQLWSLAKTFEAFNSYYKAHMIYFEMVGDFNGIVDLTILSEQWLQQKKINALRFDANYNKFILVYAHLRAKRYNDGLAYAQQFLPVFQANSTNWFAFHENYFLLAVHSKNIELAEAIILKIANNTAFEKISSTSKERWKLYKTYFYTLFPSTYYESSGIGNNNPYLLSLPEYSKDKQGFNVAILILQFIYFLKKNDSEALLYRIESLKKYILTHLKDTFSQRSKIFLKLLILTVVEDFDAEACSKKGQKLYQKLIETPTPGDAYAEIEIVPYEHLWELILSILINKN